jgi:hypothetical protein
MLMWRMSPAPWLRAPPPVFPESAPQRLWAVQSSSKSLLLCTGNAQMAPVGHSWRVPNERPGWLGPPDDGWNESVWTRKPILHQLQKCSHLSLDQDLDNLCTVRRHSKREGLLSSWGFRLSPPRVPQPKRSHVLLACQIHKSEREVKKPRPLPGGSAGLFLFGCSPVWILVRIAFW